MNSLQFAYWLQGYFEIRREEIGLSDKQVEIIKNHLQLVLTKVTPFAQNDFNKEDILKMFNDSGANLLRTLSQIY